MAKYELKLPKMGESVAEASITSWLKKVGDTVDADDVVLEIATDKVDTDVPSEVDGVLVECLFEVGDVIKVGQTIAIIETEQGGASLEKQEDKEVELSAQEIEDQVEQIITQRQDPVVDEVSSSRFYSPLVKNIAKQEGVSIAELDQIQGTGVGSRVTKNDILTYLTTKQNDSSQAFKEHLESDIIKSKIPLEVSIPNVELSGAGDEIIEMTRMGKIISKHMISSVQTSAHVQSFIEVDVTNIVRWRSKVKDAFFKRESEKLTFTPIFMEIVAQALKKHPLMNITVDGDTIIKKKAINIGMAAALPDGDLIVPVIKNADLLSLVGMARTVNDLANRARKGELKPDDIQEGTYTVTNIGSFGTVMGTPIINQPQVGILALGAIRKVPSVIETPEGDFIGIRSKMYLSHSYDHRVVNGALGGMFIKTIKEIIENWDMERLV